MENTDNVGVRHWTVATNSDAIRIGGSGIREWMAYCSMYYWDWYIKQYGIQSGWLTNSLYIVDWDIATNSDAIYMSIGHGEKQWEAYGFWYYGNWMIAGINRVDVDDPPGRGPTWYLAT